MLHANQRTKWHPRLWLAVTGTQCSVLLVSLIMFYPFHTPFHIILPKSNFGKNKSSPDQGTDIVFVTNSTGWRFSPPLNWNGPDVLIFGILQGSVLGDRHSSVCTTPTAVFCAIHLRYHSRLKAPACQFNVMPGQRFWLQVDIQVGLKEHERGNTQPIKDFACSLASNLYVDLIHIFREFGFMPGYILFTPRRDIGLQCIQTFDFPQLFLWQPYSDIKFKKMVVLVKDFFGEVSSFVCFFYTRNEK